MDDDQLGGIKPAAKQLIERKGREWTRQFMLALKELLNTTEGKPVPSRTTGPLLPKMPLPPHVAKKRPEEH